MKNFIFLPPVCEMDKLNECIIIRYLSEKICVGAHPSGSPEGENQPAH